MKHAIAQSHHRSAALHAVQCSINMSRQHSSLYLYRDVNTKEMTSPPSYGEATSGPPEDTKVNIEAAPGPGVQQQRPPAAAPPAPAISFAAERVQAVCKPCNKQVGTQWLIRAGVGWQSAGDDESGGQDQGRGLDLGDPLLLLRLLVRQLPGLLPPRLQEVLPLLPRVRVGIG